MMVLVMRRMILSHNYNYVKRSKVSSERKIVSSDTHFFYRARPRYWMRFDVILHHPCDVYTTGHYLGIKTLTY